MDLPVQIAEALKPLFDAYPMDSAMVRLVPETGASKQIQTLVEAAIQTDAIASQPSLIAALWLYVDELDRSHVVSQSIDDATGSYWHGIMHRREGDFSNSHHWFRKVGAHPVVEQISEYDPHQFIDDVEAATDTDSLVIMQRREWQALFAWCCQQAEG